MGQPTKISKTNKRLNVLETFLEIFTQFVVFFAIEVMAIIGIANRPNTDIVLCLLCIIPTVALYIVRRKVNNFTAFMIINLIFPLASLAFARNDLEIVTFFLATLVISLRSIRIKNAMNKLTELANNSPVSKDFVSNLKSAADEDVYSSSVIKERMHPAYALVMFVGYVLGGSNNNDGLVGLMVLLFVVFVLSSLIYNQVKELNKVIKVNSGKSEFPLNRIINANVTVTFVIALVMAVFMYLFYYGKYGNLFSIIGGFLFAIVKLIIKFILILWGSGGDSTDSASSSDEASSGYDISFAESTPNDNAAIFNAIFEAFALVLVIALAVSVIYLVFKYAKSFKRTKLDEFDEVEFLKEEKISKDKAYETLKKESSKGLSNNDSYRKIFKKYAKSKKRYTKYKKNGLKPDKLMPGDISSKLIIEDEEKAAKITEAYEKARYSREEVTKEEISYLKKL